MTITADKQLEFNGLRLDGRYEIRSVEGIADAPDLRTSDLTLAGRDGLFVGNDLLGGRTVTITLDVYAWSEAEFYEAVRDLRAAFKVGGASELPLSFQLPGIGDGSTLRINARGRRLALPQTPQYWQQASTAVVELFATNPRILADTAQTTTITLNLTAAGGHVWPQSWPMSWGGPASSNSIQATNAGTFNADALYRVDGPIVNPRIENLSTGATFKLGLTIAAGDHVLIDTSTRTVLLNGTANRYTTVTTGSTWPVLVPGSNTIRIGADTTTAALFTVTWRSTWI